MKCKGTGFAQILRSVLIEHPCIALGVLVTSVGAVIVAVLPPLLLERIVNLLAGGSMPAAIWVLGYLGLLILSGILDSCKEVLITVFGQKVTHQIRSEMVAKLERLPAAFYVDHEAGVIASQLVNDVNAVDTLFSSGILSMMVDAGKIIAIMAVIFSRSIGLAILIFLVMPAIYCFTRVVQRKTLSAQLRNRAAVAQANSIIPETLKNIRTIKLFRVHEFMRRRYDQTVEESFRAQEVSNFFDAVYSPVIVVVSSALVAVMMLCAALSGYAAAWFGISVGTAVALINYIGKIFDPLENIGMEIQSIQSAIAGVNRVQTFMRQEELPEIHSSPKVAEGPAVDCSQVTFGYSRQEAPVLQDFSLQVNTGEHVTLTGRTGAGKSTVFRLLLGMYTPDAGRIRIMGQIPEQILPSQRRIIYGYVQQHYQPVPGTIADQISLGDLAVTRSEIEESLRLVGLWDCVTAMEKRLDTPYNQRLFSQGQNQLLSIARAVVKNPHVLLLDEITANLDSDTESQVLSALEAASAHRTVLSISHRLYERTGGRQVRIGDTVEGHV